ncbi:MAG TPA: twin-arginine translocase TatA/TatE family subunit [Desulfuromonadales bacterium]|nr:twin-arginine translocase TatA/TatE family subunit [Desulfuromonadales bacterium]
MFGLGGTELTIILLVVLVIFGAGKMPEIGGALGRGIRNFKKGVHGEDEIDVTPTDEDNPDEDKKNNESS